MPERTTVTFLGGSELQQRLPLGRGRFLVSHSKVYGLVWFNNDEVAILEMTDPTMGFGMGGEFRADHFDRVFHVFTSDVSFRQFNGDDDRRWRVNCRALLP